MAKRTKTKAVMAAAIEVTPMVDPDRDPADPDSSAHDALAALLLQTSNNVFPSGGPFDGILTSENRAIVVALATIGLILDKRLAMSERQRG